MPYNQPTTYRGRQWRCRQNVLWPRLLLVGKRRRLSLSGFGCWWRPRCQSTRPCVLGQGRCNSAAEALPSACLPRTGAQTRHIFRPPSRHHHGRPNRHVGQARWDDQREHEHNTLPPPPPPGKGGTAIQHEQHGRTTRKGLGGEGRRKSLSPFSSHRVG